MLLFLPVSVPYIRPKCSPETSMKNITMNSTPALLNDAMLELRVQNPPVAMVENELQTASNQPIPTIFSSTVWISVNPT